MWCGGCGAVGVKKVYFRCGWGWECGVVVGMVGRVMMMWESQQ